MLDKISGRVPARDEFNAARRAFEDAGERVENLEMSLSRILDRDGEFAEPFTAEQAWRLHDFADAVESDAETAMGNVRRVKEIVRQLWMERYDEAAAPTA